MSKSKSNQTLPFWDILFPLKTSNTLMLVRNINWFVTVNVTNNNPNIHILIIQVMNVEVKSARVLSLLLARNPS